MIICIIYNIFKVDEISRIPHSTQAYEGNLNVDRIINLRKFSYIFKRKMELDGVLSKGEKTKTKQNKKTKTKQQQKKKKKKKKTKKKKQQHF